MSTLQTSAGDHLHASLDAHVGIVEMRRPPHNFFDIPLMRGVAEAFEAFEADPECRVILLCAQGKSFCAGANFGSNDDGIRGNRRPRELNPIYTEATRLFACTKPSVAAVHGAAIGGGLGVAMATDFRVTCPEARFSANFNRLGFHPGFGLTASLPRLIGPQKAALLFYTGRRIGGEEAVEIGMADILVAQDKVREAAMSLAREIAISSPIAVQSTRQTMRVGLVDLVRNAVAHESIEQNKHFRTEDFDEGIKAMAERRDPVFKGR